MDCQLDIPSVNAFLHATSKPARLLAEPATGCIMPHCFDRLSLDITGLVMQYIFPMRRIGEPTLYRFMRVQILQSRQPSNPAVCKFLYSGHSEDALDDARWKNAIDAVYIRMQKSIATNVFSNLCKDLYFLNYSNCNEYRLAPSLAFDKMPCLTFLQRCMLGEAMRGITTSHLLPAAKEIAIKQQFAILKIRYPALCTLLQDPKLHSYIRQRRSALEQNIVDLQSLQDRDRPLFPLNSMKVRLVTGAVAIVITTYAVCRAVYVVLRTIASILRECVPYLAVASVNVLVMGIGYLILCKMIKKAFLAPDMLSKIYAISGPLFRLSAVLLSVCPLNLGVYRCTYPIFNVIKQICQIARIELELILMRRNLQIQNCSLIAQFILFRRG